VIAASEPSLLVGSCQQSIDFGTIQEMDQAPCVTLAGYRQHALDLRRMGWRLGYSVGRWDGDTLVVDLTGFNGKTWLDVVGHPTTDALHVTERFRRRDFGHLDIQLTIDDPKALHEAMDGNPTADAV